MSKVAKGKGKTRGKNGKTEKRGEEPDNDRYTAFKITIRGYCLRFFIKAVTCIKKRKPRLTSCLANFVGNLDARVELRQYQSLSQSNFFLFLTESCSFFPLCTCFFLFFSLRTFFRFWFFHEQRFYHKQRVFICDVNKVMKITWKSSPNMSGCQENSLRWFA